MIMQRLSPLARGTLTHHIRVRPRDRFIPAGAGNTRLINSKMVTSPVYPRWRGEHRLLDGITVAISGLSPLARGTLRPGRTGHHYHRFIPAGAGNTVAKYSGKQPNAVYPRWRGEHAHHPLRRAFFRGLSPLARGTPLSRERIELITRFIPAGAGNTLC
ncbi:Domain of uncharacterised function (DUF2825) [Salmonella enterica subsp. enterica]|uniref:Domain of uncharacterized function (DUF2825) n=1 Tax=Salmonella enterica I TaxID=59201 RepID=A0A3S4F2E6_SALET|nr:Domain of uncharacterised function (DUF2825) [Salmonella enterica subsp. enterica]